MEKIANPDSSGQGLPHPQTTAFLAKALADENRIRIILALANGARSVSQLAGELNISQPLASHHLKELKRALLVTVKRDGPFIYYGLAHHKVASILGDLSGLAAELLAKRNSF